MPLITYNRDRTLGSEYSRIRTENGIVSPSSSPFLNQFMSLFETEANSLLSSIYDLEKEMDISRCSEPFLNIWGKILGEPRGTIGYATELGLSNIRLSISPSGTTAGSISVDGGAIPVPRGILLYGDSATAKMRILDNTVIPPTSDGVYVRAISEVAGSIVIPAYTLKYCDISITGLPGVDPVLSKGCSLTVTQPTSISGGTSPMSVDVYRYVLLKKAESLGLVNATRMQTLMRIPDVVHVIVDEHTGGACVYLDVRIPDVAPMIVSIARKLVQNMEGIGKSITVHPPIYRGVKWAIKADLYTTQNENSSKASIKDSVCTILNNIEMGGQYTPSDVLSSIVSTTSSVRGLSTINHYYAGRKVERGPVQMEFNEKMAVTISDITVI